MIAPTGARCKGPRRLNRARRTGRALASQNMRHGIVSGIIIPPYFCPAPALLDCEKWTLRRPDPFGSGFLSPQPPGAAGIGPVRRTTYSYPGPTRVGPFSFWGIILPAYAPVGASGRDRRIQ